MSDWPDRKIRSTALWYITQTLIAPSTWRHTLVDSVHPQVSSRVVLRQGELPLISFFLTVSSWYLLTSRRVMGSYLERMVDVAALDVLDRSFGGFKGHSGAEVEIMTLRLAGGQFAALQYETGRASMAPIHYFMYWKHKYPILDKLRDDLVSAPDNRNPSRVFGKLG